MGRVTPYIESPDNFWVYRTAISWFLSVSGRASRLSSGCPISYRADRCGSDRSNNAPGPFVGSGWARGSRSGSEDQSRLSV